MDLSINDVSSLIKNALCDIPAEEQQLICNEFAENCMDGSAMFATIENVGTLFNAFPCIAKGHLFKIYGEFVSTVKQQKMASDLSADLSFSTEPVSAASESIEDSALSVTVSSASSEASDQIDTLSASIPVLKNLVPKKFPIDRCNFGFNAKEVMRCGKITSAGKREITGEIIRVMKLFENNPSSALRKSAVEALIRTGKAAVGMEAQVAKKFWLRKISQKINTQAKLSRKQSGIHASTSKRATNNKLGVAKTELVERKKIDSIPFNTEYKVEEMEEARQDLVDEFKKPASVRNKKVIKDHMAFTFEYRRSTILQENLPPKQLLNRWPAIGMYDELIRDFKRIEKISEEEVQSRAQTLFPKVIAFITNKHCKSSYDCSLLSKIPLDEDENFGDVHIVIGVLLLCNMLKTNTKREFRLHQYLLDVCPENTTLDEIKEAISDRHQPFVMCYGDILSPEKYTVFVEKFPLFSTKNALDALKGLFASYYCLNYNYSKHTCKVMFFLQAHLLGLPENSKFHSVRELAIKLQL